MAGSVVRDMAQLSVGGSSSSGVASSIDASLASSRRSCMNEDQRQECITIMLHKAQGLKLPSGTHQQLCQQYGVSRWTIWRIWKNVLKYLSNQETLKVRKDYKGRVGRKKITITDEEIMQIPLRKRCNIRTMASSLSLSKSTLHRLVKWGKVMRHSNALKPGLTEANKARRLRWCLEQIEPTSMNNNPCFKDMCNVIHVDEKWFFMSQKSQKFYLAPTETKPHRTVKHKSHITKVMFFVAIGRPLFDEDGNEVFDGKIGCWPLTKVVPAQRSSRNRPAGTLETKPIQHVNKAVIKSIIINKLLPAIRAKWPLQGDGNITIQQDNATPHIEGSDPDFLREANRDGFNISLVSQPPNSPDMNTLDLGFFCSAQSIMHQQMPTTIDELVMAVRDAFQNYDTKRLNFVWLSYMLVMREVMKVGGGNNYQIPHINKFRLDRMGILPKSILVSPEIITQVIHTLQAQAQQENEGQQVNEGLQENEGLQVNDIQQENEGQAEMEVAMLNLNLN